MIRKKMDKPIFFLSTIQNSVKGWTIITLFQVSWEYEVCEKKTPFDNSDIRGNKDWGGEESKRVCSRISL